MIIIPYLVVQQLSQLIDTLLKLDNLILDAFLHNIPPILAGIAGYYAFVRWVEKRPVTELGLKRAGHEFGVGVLIGVLLIALSVGVLWILRFYQVSGTNSPIWLLLYLITDLNAGVIEELIFRGVVFRIIEEYIGSWLALAFSALLFGFLHASNPGATIFSSTAIALEAGILLGAAFMVTRRLWLPIGIHYAWNFMQGAFFGVAVSGNQKTGFLESTLTGPELLSGGAFGAEASIFAVLICTAVGLYFVFKAQKEGQALSPIWQREKELADSGQ